MNRNFVSISAFLVLCLLVTACNMPEGYPTQVAAGDSSPTPTVTLLAQDAPSLTPTAVPGAAPVVNCSPTVTTNTDANVRSGPGQVYGVIGYIPTGGSAPVAGKNADGTWWYIQFAAGPGGYAWIAGSVTISNCIPATLAVIAAPPTPVIPPTTVPSNTPVPAGPPSATPTWALLFPIDPGIFLINTSTPTPIFIPSFPTIDIPCLFC
jgi:hypothetical protein